MNYLGYKFEQKNHGVLELKTDKQLTVLHIPDTHGPFEHPDTLPFLTELKKYYKPDIILHQGDEIEAAGFGQWEQNPDMPGISDELEAGIVFLQKLHKLFPDLLLCESNHTSRMYRKAFSAGLPRRLMKSYNEIFEVGSGWSWWPRIVINDVLSIHGEACGTGRNAAWNAMLKNKMSTIIGHIHGFGGVQYSQDSFRQTFAANAGCLIDLNSLAMQYGAKYADKGTLGAVVRIGDSAHFERMNI